MKADLNIMIGMFLIVGAIAVTIWLIIVKRRESKINVTNVWLDAVGQTYLEKKDNKHYTVLYFTIESEALVLEAQGVWTEATQGLRVSFTRTKNGSIKVLKMEPRRMVRPNR